MGRLMQQEYNILVPVSATKSDPCFRPPKQFADLCGVTLQSFRAQLKFGALLDLEHFEDSLRRFVNLRLLGVHRLIPCSPCDISERQCANHPAFRASILTAIREGDPLLCNLKNGPTCRSDTFHQDFLGMRERALAQIVIEAGNVLLRSELHSFLDFSELKRRPHAVPQPLCGKSQPSASALSPSATTTRNPETAKPSRGEVRHSKDRG